jgi:hypothetical protein
MQKIQLVQRLFFVYQYHSAERVFITKIPAPPVAANNSQQSDAPKLLKYQTVASDDS